jgi:hypothetical protein
VVVVVLPTGESFCTFHARCPHAMPIRVEHAPPRFRTHPDAVTACYLYRQAPVVEAEGMSDILSAAGPSAGPGLGA